MGSIVDYGTLSAAVQSFMLGRTDLATPMADLVTIGESYIYDGIDTLQPLRCRLMETISTITLTSGVGPLPATYLQWRRVVEVTSPRRELEWAAPAYFDQQYASRSGGPASVFTIIGSNLYVAPVTGSDIEMTHYAKPTALDSTDDTSTNPILLAYPQIYLRACQAAACEWLKDWQEMQVQNQLLKGSIYAINREVQMDALAKSPLTFRRQVR